VPVRILGFVQSQRFDAIFAVEWDDDAAETYRANFGDHVVAAAIEDVKSLPPGDVIIGGPPCQGFAKTLGVSRATIYRSLKAAA
jgi:DNA (cytosine-5)-methyltransferase 1